MGKWILLSVEPPAIIFGVVAFFWMNTSANAATQILNEAVRPSPPSTCETAQSIIVDPALKPAMRFRDLTSLWHAERGTSSWVSDMATCPAYQGIIGMGEAAIPLILASLRAEGDEPDHWFWALRSIVGEDPIKDEDRGDIVKMASAWLEWGCQQGYVR
jgi:hypothetical protein